MIWTSILSTETFQDIISCTDCDELDPLLQHSRKAANYSHTIVIHKVLLPDLAAAYAARLALQYS